VSLAGCGNYWDYVDDLGGSDGSDGQQGAAGNTSGSAGAGGESSGGDAEPFALRVVTQGLFSPLEVTWGPDDQLWITERIGRRIVRVDPNTGARSPVITIPDAIQTGGQDGVLGLALHPELLRETGNDYVYVAFTYDADAGPELDRRVKIRRYTYSATSGSASDPVDLLSGLQGSDDHNSGRLKFGPDARLYYTIGDQGNNQFGRKCLPIRAQELPSQAEIDAGDYAKYVGKILRLELDGSIPSDNPVIGEVRSHIYSYGHRNAQGLIFSSDGTLYSDEHGPKSDDELNRIVPGKNYGWPNVAGYRDNQAYQYENWSASSPTPCEELTWNDYVVPPSVPVMQESEFRARDFVPPIATFFTVPDDFQFQDPSCAGNEYMCWPTIAPSSLDYYAADGTIREFKNSLLITSLKQGGVFRARLSRDGRSVVGRVSRFIKTINRYRDLTIRPDSGAIYVITDNEGITALDGGGYTSNLEHRGAILEFTYTRSR